MRSEDEVEEYGDGILNEDTVFPQNSLEERGFENTKWYLIFSAFNGECEPS
tara:strand:- start:304 stop:456 length:153 start_codon:yes stop_codon:yes gene_type:complete